ncbi:hypothetical protein JTB14_029404 [Gonioctena quinquepunctata]|nr:hypothetical protein JTB14_029404 [Gonioctena quinquepunctata]
MLAAYIFAFHKYGPNSINHKFLIKSHTQNEGDSVHSLIETQMKQALKSGPIYSPGLISLIRTAKGTGEPFSVNQLSYEHFFDLKHLASDIGPLRIVKNTKNQPDKMSSRRTVLSRPRTKLYDANYNIGESYYKSALDRIDRKYSGRPLSPPRQSSPLGDIAERHARFLADDELETSRRRAEKHIKQDHVFDSRGGRIRADALVSAMENDINDETAASIRQLRARKKVSIIDDVDLESTSNNLKTHRLLDRSEKILDSVGLNDNSSRRMLENELAMKRRALKVSFDPEGDDLTKWTPLENNVASVRSRREEVRSVRSKVEDNSFRSESSAAALRAKQSRDKLNDIEEEMAAMADKQAAREARVARLRALVAETEQESSEFDLTQAKAERASARNKEQRSVHF